MAMRWTGTPAPIGVVGNPSNANNACDFHNLTVTCVFDTDSMSTFALIPSVVLVSTGVAEMTGVTPTGNGRGNTHVARPSDTVLIRTA